jgi:hypothetical protein
MEFPILVFGPGFPEKGQQINYAKTAIILPNGEKFGQGDYENQAKLAEAEAMGVSFKFLDDRREDKLYYDQGDPIDNVEGDTVTRTCEYTPTMTVDQLREHVYELATDLAKDRHSLFDSQAVECWRKNLTQADLPGPVQAFHAAVSTRLAAIKAELAALDEYADIAAYEIAGWPDVPDVPATGLTASNISVVRGVEKADKLKAAAQKVAAMENGLTKEVFNEILTAIGE